MKLEKSEISNLVAALEEIDTGSSSDSFVLTASAELIRSQQKAQEVLQSNLDNTLAELARINEQLEKDDTVKAWASICHILDIVTPGWLNEEIHNPADSAIAAIEHLAAKAGGIDKALQSKANAWEKVWSLLDAVYPGWLALSVVPVESALKAIKNLSEGFDHMLQANATMKPDPEQKCSIAEPQPIQIKMFGPVISLPLEYKFDTKEYPEFILQIFRDAVNAVLIANFHNSMDTRIIFLKSKDLILKREFQSRLSKTFGHISDLHFFEKLCNEFEWV